MDDVQALESKQQGRAETRRASRGCDPPGLRLCLRLCQSALYKCTYALWHCRHCGQVAALSVLSLFLSFSLSLSSVAFVRRFLSK